MKKFHIKKGDTVIVNAGNDKGKTGKVLEVVREKDRVIVEGVNMVSKHTKPNSKFPQGGIIKQEAAMGQGPIAVAGFYTSDGSMAAAFADDYWRPDNTGAFYPAAYNMGRDTNVNSYNYLRNDRMILNMAYLRLKNLTVGYTLPSKLTQKVAISKLRIYFTAENILTWDKLRGLPIDPECVTGYSMWGSNYAQGWTGVGTPVFKTLTAGLQLNF